MITTPILGQTEKLEALERVLGSQTLQRSEQLRAFLKFVVNEDLAGRGAELSEYRIGAEALGRGQDFSPQEDGVVRNRAHALREKLETYYAKEHPDDPLRIELPKGSYRPVFRVTGEQPAIAPARWRPNVQLLGAFGLGVVLMAAAWIISSARSSPHLEPSVREVFGPLLDHDGSVLVCLATPVHLVLRPVPTRVNPGSPAGDGMPWLEWYASRRTAPSASELFLRPSPTSLFWGDAVAALTIVRALSLEGIPVEILQEQYVSRPALRGRNVILIGRSEYSELVRSHLREAEFDVAFVPEIRETGVVAKNGDRFLPQFNDKQELTSAFGVVTVLPTRGTDLSPRRTIVLSGTTSPGTQAAAEFITNSRHLAELGARLKGEGHSHLPESMQIVVQANVQATSVLNVGYAAHRVVEQGRDGVAKRLPD